MSNFVTAYLSLQVVAVTIVMLVVASLRWPVEFR